MKKLFAILNMAAVLSLLPSASAQGAPSPQVTLGHSSTNPPPLQTNTPPVLTTHSGLTNIVVWTNVPPGWTNNPGAWTNIPPAFTNTLPAFTNGLGWSNSVVSGTNVWWTNTASLTNGFTPPDSTNAHHPRAAPPPGVQTVIKQFKAQRARLIDQLKNASDAQRQQILQQLSALREQLQDQIEKLRLQAREEALDMKNHLNNNFAPPNSAGQSSPSSGTGRPRHP